jgi:hypothetical protein
VSPLMELRDFTRDDWAAYSGCSTDSPFIGDGPDFTVIVDGVWVETHPHDRSFQGMSFRFPTPGVALAFALSLRGTETDVVMAVKAQEYAMIARSRRAMIARVAAPQVR